MRVTPRTIRLARLGAVALVLVGLVAAYRLGLFTLVADPKSLARTLVALGVWGHLAFILAYTVLQPFGVPGTVFIVAAPLIWPWQTAFVLSMVGTMAASVVGFAFARFVAKGWVSARIPARLRRYDDALERNALVIRRCRPQRSIRTGIRFHGEHPKQKREGDGCRTSRERSWFNFPRPTADGRPLLRDFPGLDSVSHSTHDQ